MLKTDVSLILRKVPYVRTNEKEMLKRVKAQGLELLNRIQRNNCL